MPLEHSLLTAFALNELEGSEAEQVSSQMDTTAREEVEHIRQVASLIERALANEPMPIVQPRRSRWLVGSAAAVAAAVAFMIFAIPHFTQRNGEQVISLEEDAFAEFYSPEMDKDAIRQVVRAHLSALQTCYEDQLKVQPSLAGKLLVHFDLNASGSVSEVLIKKSTLQSAPFANCIVSQVRTWKFPASPSGAKSIVEYPFIFSAK